MLQKTMNSGGDGADDENRRDSHARSRRITLLFAVVILTPSLIGFVLKFGEFIHSFREDSQGAFAISPMVNYLLASLGFFCLLLWATKNGAYDDLEAPKYTMLSRELWLDERERQLARDDQGEPDTVSPAP